ncbi:hypothetical protein DICPUDRAFT_158053 [Dictyostelium purpureum]|uniref:Uncharacterized protein n=1 Tax=Dictyostelium purpureum TaxID=5786 RepID=F1A0Q0_DICPU|nr:uncharacterized protein DICPUDRAFT_158053 [Dictyostelium purpureum]EGC30229.1 hypothetical protein DICPUDRAFT_158053 [Dictyostelium purpureum]|eukprot:XP_003293243.1 hypothetical protein DICPUDRAFT_158053 [Dictyostelium purpureum]
MNHHHNHKPNGECGHECNHHQVDSVTQSLDELNFERGIWGSIINSDYKKVEQLLDKKSSLANSVDSSGYYPLHYAVRSDSNNNIVKLLLDNGADVNCKTQGGATPLHRSSFCGSLKNTKLLLECNAKIDEQDSDGMTALHKAYKQNHKEIVNLLLSFGANETIKDKKQQTPIELTSSK